LAVLVTPSAPYLLLDPGSLLGPEVLNEVCCWSFSSQRIEQKLDCGSCAYLERLGTRGGRGVTSASSSRGAGALRGISADDPLRQSLLAEEKEGLSGLKRGMSFTAAPYSDSSSGLWGIGDSLRSGCILGQPKAGGN
jgi:hypothetical protein